MKGTADRSRASRPVTLFGPWLFFVLVFFWTWFFWILAAVSGTSVRTIPGQILLLLGLLGPMLGGVGFTYLGQDKKYRREYWLRILDPGRIEARWYLVILLFVPALLTGAVLLDIASGGNETLAQIGKRVAPFLSAPLTIVPFALGVLIRGPFPEELGWRGYALDQLQARWSALVSSLILGAIWALWHLPLFFIKDMYHYGQGAWSPGFWLFMLVVFPTAIIYTWIFNNTRRSTFAAILFHFMSNVTYEIANVTAGTNVYSTLLWIIAAIAVVAFWGADTVTRRDRAPTG